MREQERKLQPKDDKLEQINFKKLEENMQGKPVSKNEKVTLTKGDLDAYQTEVKKMSAKEAKEQVQNTKSSASFNARSKPKLATGKMSSVTPLEHQEMNLNKDYWAKKFLYPYALDPAPLRPSDYLVQGVTLGN